LRISADTKRTFANVGQGQIHRLSKPSRERNAGGFGARYNFDLAGCKSRSNHLNRAIGDDPARGGVADQYAAVDIDGTRPNQLRE
jgi:hypothetical protein